MMEGSRRKAFFRPIGRRLNNLGQSSSAAFIRGTQAILGSDAPLVITNGGDVFDPTYEDDTLAPVMPAIDAVQQLIEEENKNKAQENTRPGKLNSVVERVEVTRFPKVNEVEPTLSTSVPTVIDNATSNMRDTTSQLSNHPNYRVRTNSQNFQSHQGSSSFDPSVTNNSENPHDDESFVVKNYPIQKYKCSILDDKQDEYEFIPQSVILDVYSNDPEVKRFLKQLPRIGTEFGFNEQDYKCYSCRRPIGMVFGQSRLCHFDGHHYCLECHLGEKSTIPARVLCNWDFAKYPISKRNQHFLTLIANEPMFELKTMAPLLYETSPELKEIEELRYQAFFVRSYCFTCVQESISFELTKLVWPREHLIKQTDSYSLEDFLQIKSGALKTVLKNVIAFGRQHVLTCMLCRQKGFICEICKSSQIIYPFDTESVYRCNNCQSIYHKTCFKTKPHSDKCPRCQRLQARRVNQ